MIPKDPGDININASQQGLLEIVEYFFRQKIRLQEEDIAAEAERGESEGKNL